MRLRPARFAIALMLALSVGGHWAVLQSVAWVGMTLEFSRSMPVDEALLATFDGNHPCPLCKAVKQGREQERKQSLLKPGNDFKGFLELPGVNLSGPRVAALIPVFEWMPPARFFVPPHPPPRGV